MMAVFSPCGQYRHLLTSPGRDYCGWVMCNPSIAGGVDDDTGEVRSDPTARRVAEFSKKFGYDGYVIANCYDLVSTDPVGLWRHPEPVSAANDAYLMAVATLPLVIMACGRNVRRPQLEHVARVLRGAGAELWCIGVNDDGSPKHPLYLPYASSYLRKYVG